MRSGGGHTEIALRGAPLCGTLAAIPSKSALHRFLICAALAEAPSRIPHGAVSADVAATAACLRAMGAEITDCGNAFCVTPIRPAPTFCELPCGESGSTLRFLLPVAGVLGLSARFLLGGRLSDRPITPLLDALSAHGMRISRESNAILCAGRLTGGDFLLPGDLSSQFFSGLLLALPLAAQDSTLTAVSPPESRPYIDLTRSVLRSCGIRAEDAGDRFRIPGNQRPRLPEAVAVPGDWTDAAVFLCGGAMSGSVTVTGLGDDPQGSALLAILSRFGADVRVCGGAVTVSRRRLRGTEISAADIPDLVPPLAALAVSAEGDTVITHAARLRYKESDRLDALCRLLTALGGSVTELPDGLVIHGTGHVSGGVAPAVRDHRIAMAAALLSLISDAPVTVREADCTDKSHPGFWEALSRLQKGECP